MSLKKQLISVPLWAIIACILWATAFPAIKIGLNYCGPFTFAGIRFMISGLLLLPFWIFQKDSLKISFRQWKFIFSVTIFQTFILYALFYLGVSLLSAAIAAIIVGASPLITAITTHVLTRQDKITKSKLLSILFGMLGIVIITINKSPIYGGNYYMVLGIVMLIVGNISSAIGNILVSNNKNLLNIFKLTSLQIFIGGFLLLIVGISFEGLPGIPTDYKFYLVLSWLSFLSAAAFLIWFILLKRDDVLVSDLNIWKFIIPVFGAIFSWILISSEKPSFIIILGMMIAASSVILYNIKWKKLHNNL